MMNHQDICPKCSNDLNNLNNILLTKESKVFKGHNVYMMCKKCGYVMIYNKDRDLIFSIDKYENDPEVLEEIEQLINEVDSHYTLGEVVETSCNGMCESCQGCQEIKEETIVEEVKEMNLDSDGDAGEQEPAFTPEMVKDSFLVIQNSTGNAQIVKLEELQFVPDLQNCSVFALEEVMLEPVVTFKIHKK
jgi:predicted nucleic-acid-binding Zn-ribbon protein